MNTSPLDILVANRGPTGKAIPSLVSCIWIILTPLILLCAGIPFTYWLATAAAGWQYRGWVTTDNAKVTAVQVTPFKAISGTPNNSPDVARFEIRATCEFQAAGHPVAAEVHDGFATSRETAVKCASALKAKGRLKISYDPAEPSRAVEGEVVQICWWALLASLPFLGFWLAVSLRFRSNWIKRYGPSPR